MTPQTFNETLFPFLDASPTPYHVVGNMQRSLEAAGFTALDETQPWQLTPGTRYYVIRNGSLIAFNYPDDTVAYTMIGAHTDSPTLRLKPDPVIRQSDCITLGVEPYGGLLMNPWFDRDLGIAGKVAWKDATDAVHESLVDSEAAVAVIASLAIHIDRDANKSRSINAQQHLPALIGMDEDFDFEAWISALLGQEARLLSHELSLYDRQGAAYVGVGREMIASARLDNLLSCHVAMQTLLGSEATTPMMIVCSDHEEVGSGSTSGAAGPFLEQVLRRIVPDFEAFARLCRSSVMISCDNAHARHPNYADKHDANHAPRMNGGAVIKINANQRYASAAPTIARFKLAAESAGAPLQQFVTRSDLGCGSTIGPITATRLGIETLDVGLPTLAMHSIRELAGVEDAAGLVKTLGVFATEDEKIK